MVGGSGDGEKQTDEGLFCGGIFAVGWHEGNEAKRRLEADLQASSFSGWVDDPAIFQDMGHYKSNTSSEHLESSLKTC